MPGFRLHRTELTGIRSVNVRHQVNDDELRKDSDARKDKEDIRQLVDLLTSGTLFMVLLNLADELLQSRAHESLVQPEVLLILGVRCHGSITDGRLRCSFALQVLLFAHADVGVFMISRYFW